MARKKYIIETDGKSSFTGIADRNSGYRYDQVMITNAVSVTPLDGNPKLYTSEELEKACQAGQNEAWELAQKILELPSKGGYTPEELIDIFGSDAVPYVHDLIRRYTFHDVVTKIHEREEKKAKEFHPGDVVTLTWGSKIHKAVVTTVMPDLLGVVLDTGDVDDVGKSRCTKTGKTLNVASLLVELNGEEK